MVLAGQLHGATKYDIFDYAYYSFSVLSGANSLNKGPNTHCKNSSDRRLRNIKSQHKGNRTETRNSQKKEIYKKNYDYG